VYSTSSQQAKLNPELAFIPAFGPGMPKAKQDSVWFAIFTGKE